jgi:hypothetical protein
VLAVEDGGEGVLGGEGEGELGGGGGFVCVGLEGLVLGIDYKVVAARIWRWENRARLGLSWTIGGFWEGFGGVCGGRQLCIVRAKKLFRGVGMQCLWRRS